MLQKSLAFLMLNLAFAVVFAVLPTPEQLEEAQKLAEMKKCINDQFNTTTVDKAKVCNSECEKIFKEYLLKGKEAKNRRVHENKIYKQLQCAAISDERVPTVVENQSCINSTAVEKCRIPTSTKLTSKIMSFNKHHDVHQTTSSCINSEKINTCLIQTAFVNCPNTTIEYFKDVMEMANRNCTKATLGLFNAAYSHEGSGLKVILGSIFTVLLIASLIHRQ